MNITKIKQLTKKVVFYFIQTPISHLVLLLALLWPLLAVFRMKSVEQGYILSKNNRSIKVTLEQNKKLKAQQAQMLSVTHLQTWATKYQFALPNAEQIIFVH